MQAAVWQTQHGSARPRAWKIGNSPDDKEPVRAAMPEVLMSGSRTPRARFRLFGIECEIAVKFTQALPRRATPYAHAEVLAAIGSAHVAIEIVDTALADYIAAGPLMGLADSMLHGSFVLGEAITDWRSLDWTSMTAHSFIDEVSVAAKTAGHPLTDPLTNLAWWVNSGSREWGGVQAGDIVTTGTWNGMPFAAAPESFEAKFSNMSGQILGRARIEFSR